MKILSLFFVLFISTKVLANPWGGVVKTKQGNQVYLNCKKFEDNRCHVFSIVTKKADAQFTQSSGHSLKSTCLSQISKMLGKRFHQNQNIAYEHRYLGISHAVENSCMQNTDKPAKCILPLMITFPLDIPFMPIVASVHGVHKLFTINKSRKFNKLLKFMLNKKNIGNFEKISKNEFEAFVIYNSYNFFRDYSVERQCVEYLNVPTMSRD